MVEPGSELGTRASDIISDLRSSVKRRLVKKRTMQRVPFVIGPKGGETMEFQVGLCVTPLNLWW